MIDQVHPQQLGAWFDHQGSGPRLVLDVREPWEVQTAPVPAEGFNVLTIPMREVPARLAELDPEHPVACLCHHGMRSLQVAAFLRQRGFERVANIAGGTAAWSELDPRVVRY